ncbi:hypothetical protein HJFPF1_00543 [Paramyrothecium foliicola]|nr:hypothetical protein HJFPF1_00543 [Paramyrothecium foliicola]
MSAPHRTGIHRRNHPRGFATLSAGCVAVMDEANALVVAPFRDIVDKGKAALDNAGDNDVMRKAAQALVREGERALKRIDPLCKKQCEEYSSNFINALKEDETMLHAAWLTNIACFQDVITKFRAELNDLLWEFDDYLEPDDFDEAKFDELRAASRKAAPQVVEIITRMKLEAVPKPPPAAPIHLVTTLSPPSSPQYPSPVAFSSSPLLAMPPPRPPPTAPLPPLPRTSGSVSSRKSAMSDAGAPLGSPLHAQQPRVGRTLSYEAGHDLQAMNASPSGQLPRSNVPLLPPPRPPSANPWDYKIRPTIEANQLLDRTNINRRPAVPRPESPVCPIDQLSPDFERRSTPANSRPNSTSLARGEASPQEHDDKRRTTVSTSTYGIFPAPATTRPRAPTLPSNMSPMIPENNVAEPVPKRPSRESSVQHPHSPSTYNAVSRQRDSSALSITSDYNLSSNQSQGARSSTATGYESSRPNSNTKSSYRVSQSAAGLEVVPGLVSEDNWGPIPVESEEASMSSRTAADGASIRPATTRDSTIGGNSSFYQAGGFCDGAREIARGGAGIKKTKKPVCGIYFRMRFLQKCHLATKRNDDVLYGCPFCITTGRTMDESDATVFFNVKSFFTHLSWHTRPLPPVPGFTVVDTAEVPPEHHNDYDVHFINPPVPHPVLEEAIDLSTSPVGVAREPVRKLVGQRLLPDHTRAHELATGARVTGLTWPEKYGGEWCLGWHDGVHASVPTESLVLESPPSHEIKMGGMSNMRAKVRWRFPVNNKDKGDWLALSKGDTITNINWAYIDHWCWSGTNSKGKWGIFPQVFIDTNTMQEVETVQSDRTSVVSNEKKGSGIRAMFSSRNKPAATKRPSIAGSTGRHETATASLASAFIYPAIGERGEM